jgi:hypothetical protein
MTQLPEDIELQEAPLPAGGWLFEAHRAGASVGSLRLLPSMGNYTLLELAVSPAWRGQHIAKALYRRMLGKVIAEGKRVYSPAQRTPSGEGLCLMLQSLGRALPVSLEPRRGTVVLDLTGPRAQTGPTPMLDEKGVPCWPVYCWWLDPMTTDLDQLNSDSPI